MKVTRNLGVLAFVTLLCAWKTTIATIDFQNLSSRLVFDNNTSLLLIKNQQKILGWSKLSIVKENGNVPATNWIEGYSNNVIIGPSGATKVPQTNLVIANSNAITYLGPFLPLTPVPTADTINGSLWVQYKTKHHVFHNNGNTWTSRGFVRFNDGFTIMPLASVIMDTVTSVSGGMDLRDTGTLILAGDLYLAHNVTLTSGGNIKGRTGFNGPANTIFMGGDLTLAATTFARTLHITGDWSSSGTSGDLIIDGCGHTLNIGDRAQIFVDTNITLTLRNMTIKTGPKSLNNPAIQLASLGSKLTLDNVMFDLGADFHFITGQIFVHNEVAMTGTSAFVYQSPKPSYITSGATWSFEQGTTFSVAPSTYTDLPYMSGVATSNNFIVLADASSALSLNNCSFQTTYTGLRLRSGMVLFDNKVAINTQAAQELSGISSLGYWTLGAVDYPSSLALSPDGRFVATAYGSGPTLNLYRLNGSSAPTRFGSVPAPSFVNNVSWSPDGRFLAVVGSGLLQVYRFTSDKCAPTSLGTVATDSGPVGVEWSPDGRFLAVVNSTAGTIQIYRSMGSSTPMFLSRVPTYTGGQPNAVVWSPDGRFLAVANSNSSYQSFGLQVFTFNGTNALTLLGSAPTTWAQVLAWSPDGRFLAVANFNGGVQMYKFDGSKAPTTVGSASSASWSQPHGIVWSPDGRFVAIIADWYYSSAWHTALEVYRFDGSNKPASVTGAVLGSGVYPFGLAWSPDGSFLIIAGQNNGWMQVFTCNYYDQGPSTQGFTNGLLFGDKVRGPNFNANVQVLDGATVTVKGMVSDDSA